MSDLQKIFPPPEPNHAPRVHEYGVTPIDELHDREIAEETLYWLREAGKAIATFQTMGMGGILKAAMGKKA